MSFLARAFDAAPSPADPTGTSDIRARMTADIRSKWTRVAQELARTIRAGDSLGLGADAAMGVPSGDKVLAFRKWFAETMTGTVVGGGSASWAASYLQQAAARAASRATGAVGGGVASTPSTALLAPWFASELAGICEATLQRAVRSLTEGLLSRQPAHRIAAGLKAVVVSVGLARSKLLVEYAITTAVSHATLDVLEARGVTHVGTVPETLPHVHVGDAARATPQHKHPLTGKFVTKATAQREVRRQASTGRFRPYRRGLTAVQPGAEEAAARLDPIGEVQILNADDDRVCKICLSLSESGPFSINRARGLIPAHLHCRCVFTAVDAMKVGLAAAS